MELSHVAARRCGLEVKLFLFAPSPHHLVSSEVHDPVGGGVAHLAIVEKLVCFENTVTSLPCLDAMALLVEPPVAVRVLDRECTQTDVVGHAREVDLLLGRRGEEDQCT